MIATKRHDYVPYGTIHKHPLIENHRAVNRSKVLHYKDDILRNGLLEPLVVWERNHNEYFLVGGFHRFSAITLIREDNPGYFDRVDVRVVSGELEEMRSLNLKLNADRLDARLSEYFDTVVFLNNANWSKQRIADFLDRSVSWVEEIVRFVPSMDPRLRKLLDEDKVIIRRQCDDVDPVWRIDHHKLPHLTGAHASASASARTSAGVSANPDACLRALLRARVRVCERKFEREKLLRAARCE